MATDLRRRSTQSGRQIGLRPALLGHGLTFLIAAVLAVILGRNATSLSDGANNVPSTAYDFINAVMGVSKFSAEQRARAVRLVAEGRSAYPSEWAAIESVAGKIGVTAETLLQVGPAGRGRRRDQGGDDL